mmetsp:Transcript_49467/g.150543  ORF Transcript_49467/g.150543 Transcript_49467/m.150543 type:complete len:294 (-) Transcript_49467:381-1262(-)
MEAFPLPEPLQDRPEVGEAECVMGKLALLDHLPQRLGQERQPQLLEHPDEVRGRHRQLGRAVPLEQGVRVGVLQRPVLPQQGPEPGTVHGPLRPHDLLELRRHVLVRATSEPAQNRLQLLRVDRAGVVPVEAGERPVQARNLRLREAIPLGEQLHECFERTQADGVPAEPRLRGDVGGLLQDRDEGVRQGRVTEPVDQVLQRRERYGLRLASGQLELPLHIAHDLLLVLTDEGKRGRRAQPPPCQRGQAGDDLPNDLAPNRAVARELKHVLQPRERDKLGRRELVADLQCCGP